MKLIERALAADSTEKYTCIQFVKMTELAFTPTRESPRSAGYDLLSPYDTTVPARGKELIATDLQIKLPEGCYGRIAARTDLVLRHHINVGAGVIDQDFRGNLCVLLYNHSEFPYRISRGDKIAKLICEKIFFPELDPVDKLDDTWRGARDFGSTGQN